MALSNRLNQIISEQNISKTEFARRLGITVNYVYSNKALRYNFCESIYRK